MHLERAGADSLSSLVADLLIVANATTTDMNSRSALLVSRVFLATLAVLVISFVYLKPVVHLPDGTHSTW